MYWKSKCSNVPALPISCTETRAVYKTKAFCFRSVFVPILTYGHECWVMTERVRSQIQAAKIGFLRKVRGLSLLDMVKSTYIRQSSQHQTATTLQRMIPTVLVWLCDTTVPQANSKATNGYSSEWQKA